jgi:hypothetical protein
MATTKLTDARETIRLMANLYEAQLAENEMWEVANGLEDILIKLNDKGQSSTDSFKFYSRVLKVCYQAAMSSAIIEKYKSIAHNQKSIADCYIELYTKTQVELNKFQTIQDMVYTGTLQQYVAAMESNLSQAKQNTTHESNQ